MEPGGDRACPSGAPATSQAGHASSLPRHRAGGGVWSGQLSAGLHRRGRRHRQRPGRGMPGRGEGAFESPGNVRARRPLDRARDGRDQQTFGGADASPQATPLVIGSNLIALSFTGQLVCLDRHSGEQLWSKDLVKEFAAVPVQFGFSSSPVIDSVDEGRFVVLAADDRGGLLNMNAADGTLNWRSECKTPSYATPTTAHFGGISQWVVVSESHVLGIRNTDGKRLWQYELPESGLTNVPSPLIVNDSSLLVAGQGCKGIRCLEVGSNWRVVEKWYQSRANFFYTNWIMGDQQTAIGCTDGFLAAINTKTGELLGRWRGFSDGNLVRVGNQILLLDGKGKLTVFEQAGNSDSSQSETEYLRAILQVKLPEGRYWTPPSIVDRRLLVRTGSELLSIELSRAPNRTASNAREILANELREPLSLAIQRAADTKSFDPVALIFETFEQQGQIVALKRYEQLRSSGKLNIDQRIELAEAAGNQGLDGLAAMILEHANQDVPGNTKIKAALAELRK